MAIRISLGNAGSGKSLMEVREILNNPDLKTYSNIQTNLKNQINIDPSMIMAFMITNLCSHLTGNYINTIP